jgi:DNA-binding SARP family transcriptional activator
VGTRWNVNLLGELTVRCGERRITRFRTQKMGFLLAYLAHTAGRPQSREKLIELFWPDLGEAAARNNLSTALSRLRAELAEAGFDAEETFIATRAHVTLDPQRVTTDAAELEEMLRAARRAPTPGERRERLARAVELYGGPFLGECYDDWALGEQERLASLYFQALRSLLAELERAGDLQEALEHAIRAAAVDPLREEIQYELMRLYAATGQVPSALRQYRDLQRLFREQLDVEPSAATTALALGIEKEAESRSLAAPRSGGESPAAGSSDAAGGAVPLSSPYYVVRECDEELRGALTRGESIVRISGPRQVGKSSLLARGLQISLSSGARTALTELAALGSACLASDTVFLSLAQSLADQLGLEDPAGSWIDSRPPAVNLTRYVQREVLASSSERFVWGVDEVDRLFPTPTGADILALFRSWHNRRAFDLDGVWMRLTLIMTCGTEALLAMPDPDRSPFNVGVRIGVEDLTEEQVADLNRRYGAPLDSPEALGRFLDVLGGHPYLVRRGLQELARGEKSLESLLAEPDEGPFADHLRRLLGSLRRSPGLWRAVASMTVGLPDLRAEEFYRLKSAGILAGRSESTAVIRCRLYRDYLRRHLPSS